MVRFCFHSHFEQHSDVVHLVFEDEKSVQNKRGHDPYILVYAV